MCVKFHVRTTTTTTPSPPSSHSSPSLRGRMLCRFLDDDMEVESPFRNTVERERAPAGSRWYALEDTAGFKTGDATVTEPGDVTASCGLRTRVSRGGITFAAAASRVAPMHDAAPETDVRTFPMRFDARGERACAFSDAAHKMEEHVLHDFPIQGPRTTHWRLLEIATGTVEQAARHHWWKQAMGLSLADPRIDEHLFPVWDARTRHTVRSAQSAGTCSGRSDLTPILPMGRTIRRKVASIDVGRGFGRPCLRASFLFWEGLDQKGVLWWPQNSRSGWLRSWQKKRPSSRRDGKHVKKEVWWQPQPSQEARNLGSPSSVATWRPSRHMHTVSPDLLPLPTGVSFLPGHEHVMRKCG